MNQTRKQGRFIVPITMLFVLGAASLRAENTYFAKPSGNWDVATNWSTGLVPSPTSSVTIAYGTPGTTRGTNPAIATIMGGDAVSCTNLMVADHDNTANGTLNINGGSLTVFGTSASGTGITCGNYGTGTIVQNGGVIVNSYLLYLGVYAGATGSLTLAGGVMTNQATKNYIGGNSGSTGVLAIGGGVLVNTNATLILGNGSSSYGAVNVSDGALFTKGIVCGNSPSSVGRIVQTGGVIVNGTNTDIKMGSGAGCVDSWTMTGGALTNLNAFTVANTGGSTDTWTISGGFVTNSGNVTVGSFGNGTLVITNTGSLLGGGAVTVGNSGSSSGTVTIASGGSLVAGGNITVGSSGNGALTIAPGGSLVAGGTITVGSGGGSVGTMTVAPGGSLVASNGSLTVGSQGYGTLMMSNNTLNLYPYGLTLGGGASGSGGTGSVQLVNVGLTLSNLTMTSGSRAFASMSVTGGSAVTNAGTIGFAYYAGAVGSLAVTNSYWFQNGAVSLGSTANNYGTQNLQIANSTWVQRNGGFTIGYYNSIAQLLVTNSLLDVRSNSISIGPANSSGTVTIIDSTVLCSNINPVSYGAGNATMTIGGASAVTNYGALSYGYFQNPLIANVTMTGGTWWQGGAITLPSNGSCETGTLTIAGGSFLPQSSVTVGAASTNSAVGILTLSNVTVTLPSTLTIGSTGVVNVVNSILNVTGTCTLASAAVFPGQSAVLMMTNSVVTNWGTVNASQSSAGGVSSVRQSGGSWTIVNGSSVSFGTAGAASYVVSNGVFQQTGGTFTLGSATNFNGPARVELVGTQRVFQVSNLVVNAYGAFTNHIAGYAGGLDIGLTNTTSLNIQTGVVALVYEQDPAVTGNYWGLRWLGTNHVAALNTYHTNVPPRLIWNDSALSALYTNQIGIYADATYTYVGIKVTKVLAPYKGTVMLFR